MTTVTTDPKCVKQSVQMTLPPDLKTRFPFIYYEYSKVKIEGQQDLAVIGNQTEFFNVMKTYKNNQNGFQGRAKPEATFLDGFLAELDEKDEKDYKSLKLLKEKMSDIHAQIKPEAYNDIFLMVTHDFTTLDNVRAGIFKTAIEACTEVNTFEELFDCVKGKNSGMGEDMFTPRNDILRDQSEFFKYMYAYVDLIKVDDDNEDIKDPRMKNFHQRINFIEKIASKYNQSGFLKGNLKKMEEKQQFYKGLKLATQRTLPLVLTMLAYDQFKDSESACAVIDYVAEINEALKQLVFPPEFSYMPTFADIYANLISMIPPSTFNMPPY
jgi:hypothetical protein